jgi:molybdopterin molybdotransferase
MSGFKHIYLKKLVLPILKDYKKRNTVTNFLKSIISENGVMPLTGQESFIVNSFAMADSITCLPKEMEVIEAGEAVDVYLLPYQS